MTTDPVKMKNDAVKSTFTSIENKIKEVIEGDHSDKKKEIEMLKGMEEDKLLKLEEEEKEGKEEDKKNKTDKPKASPKPTDFKHVTPEKPMALMPGDASR